MLVFQVAVQTPVSALCVGELAPEAGLPSNFSDLIQGLGDVTGAALSKRGRPHPLHHTTDETEICVHDARWRSRPR